MGQILYGASYSKAILNENSRILLHDNQIKHNNSPALFMAENLNPGTSQSDIIDYSDVINDNLTFTPNALVFNIPVNGRDVFYSFNQVKAASNQRRYNLQNGLEISLELSNMSRMYRVIMANTSATLRQSFTGERVDFINQKYLRTAAR